MVKNEVVDNLIAFSALLVCILPHCRLRDWCGNLRNESGHVVVVSTNQSHSAFSIPHFTFRIPHFTHCPFVGRLGLGARSWVRIGLGDKVRVSISYYLIYMKTCSEQFGTGIRRTVGDC